MLTATYGIGSYSIQLQQRYVAASLNGQLSWVVGRDIDRMEVASGNYTNLQLGYNGELDNGMQWRANLNVTNLFNRDPAVVPSYGTRGGAQSIANEYDEFGRRYQVSLNMNF